MTAVAQRQERDVLVHGPVAAHEAFDRPAIDGRDGRIETQDAVTSRHVELPADPDQRQSEPQEQTVAEVGVGDGIAAPRRAGKVREHRLTAAVRDLEECHCLLARHRLRAQNHEVRRRGHASARVAWGAGEIHDARVGRVAGIEREFHDAGQLLVSAHGSEGPAAEDVLPRRDGQASYRGRGRWDRDRPQERRRHQHSRHVARRH